MLNCANTAMYLPTTNFNQAIQNNTNICQQQFNSSTSIYNNFIGAPSPMIMQAPVQQDNCLQQLMGLLLPLLLQKLLVKQPTTVTQDTTTITPKTDTPTTVTTDQITINPKDKGIWGDPHYNVTGTNGKKINFTHKGTTGHTYNVFQGDGYNVDAKYIDSWGPNAPRYIGNVKMNAGSDVIGFNKAGKATINGEAIKKGSYTLADGTKVDYSGPKLLISSKEGDSSIRFTTNGKAMTVDPEGNFSGLNGILGTAIRENRKLSEKECNQFDITQAA